MIERLGHFFLFGICAFLCLPLSVSATELFFQSDTLFHFFQRDTNTEVDASVAPIYQYLQFDIGNPNVPGLAFHLNAWGRWDIADNGYYSDPTDGELLYSYLEYRGKQAQFNTRVGRQHVFEGVTNDAVDGLRLSSDLGRYFSGSVYAGQPVALDDDQGRSGDIIYGGRLAHHLPSLYDLGISYKMIRNNSNDVEEMTGIDLSAYLPYGINLLGNSAYNFATNDWAEHSYDLDFSIGPVLLRPYYQKFKYEDYFGTSAKLVNPFSFLADTGEELQVEGTDLTLHAGKSMTFTVKAKNYNYKVLDDTSQFAAVQATWAGKDRTQIGGEFGCMNGNAAQNEYYLVRLYSYWDQMPENLPLSFISSDLIYVGYDKEIYGEDRSLFISLGIGRKFLQEALEVKLSGDFSQDPYFNESLRGMLTASYWFDKKL
jgi:hypothetical protein